MIEEDVMTEKDETEQIFERMEEINFPLEDAPKEIIHAPEPFCFHSIILRDN